MQSRLEHSLLTYFLAFIQVHYMRDFSGKLSFGSMLRHDETIIRLLGASNLEYPSVITSNRPSAKSELES